MDQTVQPAIGFGSRTARVIATFFYVGFLPIVPGTFGSLATFVLYLWLMKMHEWPIYLATIIVVIAAGIWAAGRVELDTKIVDPSFVVIDEVAGQLITLFTIPFAWSYMITGFFVFRAMDIIKPFPARRVEQLHGGFGIVTDDVIAGIYGNVIMQIIVLLTA
jgi:phosphatidylglycerophosphatase A